MAPNKFCTPEDLKHPVAIAVLPLREDAIKSANKYAKDMVALVRRELKAAGNDLNVAAPYRGGLSELRRYNLFSGLTKWRKGSISAGEPCLVDVKPELVRRFLKQAEERAANQYDTFVKKLVDKIGPAKSAKLEGNHIWGYSYLTVTKSKGTSEIWHTKQITNVSKLGLYFPQWPSRKVKKKGLL